MRPARNIGVWCGYGWMLHCHECNREIVLVNGDAKVKTPVTCAGCEGRKDMNKVDTQVDMLTDLIVRYQKAAIRKAHNKDWTSFEKLLSSIDELKKVRRELEAA